MILSFQSKLGTVIILTNKRDKLFINKKKKSGVKEAVRHKTMTTGIHCTIGLIY